MLELPDDAMSVSYEHLAALVHVGLAYFLLCELEIRLNRLWNEWRECEP